MSLDSGDWEFLG